MKIKDELLYIANTLEGAWREWIDGDISETLFSNILKKKIAEIRELWRTNEQLGE